MRTTEAGANFGFSQDALDTTGGLGLGSQATLFGANRDAETATLGLYTSSAGAGAQFTATLFGADGAQRGSRDFSLRNNTHEEFTPPASAFGLEGRPGTSSRSARDRAPCAPTSASFDSGSGDTALDLPAADRTDAVLPYVATGLAQDGTGPVSDLLLWNSDLENAANVTVTYFPVSPAGSTARIVRPVRRAAGARRPRLLSRRR